MTGTDGLHRLWSTAVIKDREYGDLRARLLPAFGRCMHNARIDESSFDDLCRVYLPLAAWVDGIKGAKRLIVGVNGAQGSGKSTLSEFLSLALREGYGYRVASLSLDDIYKTRAERLRLANEIHPLLLTRGVPGTHDVDLGISLLDALATADAKTVTWIPCFDKSGDDRRPKDDWLSFQGPADVIVFEGWCVGAHAQPESELGLAVNELESTEDRDGIWRRYVNTQLATRYAGLFARIDKLIMLKVPGMQSVHEWRGVQEAKLAATTVPGCPHQIMDDAELRRFIMHYERLTRAMLAEMPHRADIVLQLDEHHRFTHIGVNH